MHVLSLTAVFLDPPSRPEVATPTISRKRCGRSALLVAGSAKKELTALKRLGVQHVLFHLLLRPISSCYSRQVMCNRQVQHLEAMLQLQARDVETVSLI